MAFVGSLAVSVVAKTDKFGKGLKAAEKELAGFKQRVKSSAGIAALAGAAGGAAFAAIGFAVSKASALVGDLSGSLRGAYKQADDLGTAAARIGIGAGSLSALGYAAQRSDVGMENLLSGLDRLNKTAGLAAMGDKGAAGAIEAMGVSAQAFAAAPIESKLAIVSGYLEKMPNAAARTAAEVALLGRGAGNFGAMLGEGRDNLAGLLGEAKALGVIIPDDRVAVLNQANDAWDRMTAAASGTASVIGGALAPYVAALANRAAQVFGIINNNAPMVTNFIQSAIKGAIQVGGVWLNMAALQASALATVGAGIGALAARGYRVAVWLGATALKAIDTFLRSPIGNLAVWAIEKADLVRKAAFSLVKGIGSSIVGVGKIIGEVVRFASKIVTKLLGGWSKYLTPLVNGVGRVVDYVADKLGRLIPKKKEGTNLADRLGLGSLASQIEGSGKGFAAFMDKATLKMLATTKSLGASMGSGGLGNSFLKWLGDGANLFESKMGRVEARMTRTSAFLTDKQRELLKLYNAPAGSWERTQGMRKWFMDKAMEEAAAQRAKIPALMAEKAAKWDRDLRRMWGGKDWRNRPLGPDATDQPGLGSTKTQLAGVIENLGTMSLKGLSMSGTESDSNRQVAKNSERQVNLLQQLVRQQRNATPLAV